MNITRVRTRVPTINNKHSDLSNFLPASCLQDPYSILVLRLGTDNWTVIDNRYLLRTTFGQSRKIAETLWGDKE